MGFLNTSDDIASNVNKATADILNSKFTQFITGFGTPILCTYYNIDEIHSTADIGTATADAALGKDSPFRFNRITNFPIYGLKDVLPTKDEVDMGLLDMSLDMEVVILPNTIKPHAFDYFIYELSPETYLTFRVDDFEFSTIKSNGYYKLSVSIKDFNCPKTKNDLERQVVSRMTAVLDNIGTQDHCILEEDIYKDINSLKKILKSLMEQYVDTFWNKKYNSFIFKNPESEYLAYDPYITEFLRRNNLVDLQDNVYIVLCNYDTRESCRIGYNKSIYRNLELQDKTRLYKLLKEPSSFPTTSTNPFYYYMEDVPFTITLCNDYFDTVVSSDKLFYVPTELIDRINENRIILPEEPINSSHYYNVEELDVITNVPDTPGDAENAIFHRDDNRQSNIYWNLIITYLNKGNCYHLLEESNVKVEDINHIEVRHDHETFIYLPMAIYILTKYVKFLMNNK